MVQDEKMHVTITLDKHILMHVVYWVVIIALAILLAIAWLKDCEASDTTAQDTVEDTQTQEIETALDAEEEAPAAIQESETCDDGIKNQDESDVDCGGSCTGCSAGDTCSSANDCLADYCTDGQCSSTAPISLSGSVDLQVTDADIEVNENTGAVRITKVSYRLDNGIEDRLGLVLFKVFLKSKKDGTYCLNQMQGEERDCTNPFATFTAPGADSGEDVRRTQNLEGTYFGSSYVANFGSTTFYDHGDDFQIYLYLYDESGNLIGDETISAFRTVSP